MFFSEKKKVWQIQKCRRHLSGPLWQKSVKTQWGWEMWSARYCMMADLVELIKCVFVCLFEVCVCVQGCVWAQHGWLASLLWGDFNYLLTMDALINLRLWWDMFVFVCPLLCIFLLLHLIVFFLLYVFVFICTPMHSAKRCRFRSLHLGKYLGSNINKNKRSTSESVNDRLGFVRSVNNMKAKVVFENQ